MPLDKQYRELFNIIEVEDILALRLFKFGVKIKDLFLCCPIPNEGDWKELDYDLETKYGRLKVFFVKDVDLKTNLLLHKDKFSYPTPGFLSSLRTLPLQKDQVESEIKDAAELQRMEDEEIEDVS